ncbi:6-phosphofructokinase [bacterium]|nr:MAG: 6-phosphofructokinase [bacterium]
MKRPVGILTGGGDCPGLNAVIRAVVRRATLAEVPILGIKRGWDGLRDGDFAPLTRSSVSGILARGGTILGTSRTNPLADADSLNLIRKNFAESEMEGVIVVGGNGTLAAAREMFHRYNMPVVGVPKTIDNDLRGTDMTFGFDTAVSIATDAIDRLHTTAESHDRVMILEVMGRMVGWIAATAGIAGGADIVLVPEKPFKMSEIVRLIESRRKRKLTFSIIVVAEAARPDDSEDFLSDETKEMLYNERNLGGIGRQLAREIEKRTSIETRVTVLGYTQRGGSPTPYDRVLATRYGVGAMELVLEEKWGQMVAMHGPKVTHVSLDEATQSPKELDSDLYRTAEMFFG